MVFPQTKEYKFNLYCIYGVKDNADSFVTILLSSVKILCRSLFNKGSLQRAL